MCILPLPRWKQGNYLVIHIYGVDVVRAGLINMSEQEENVGADCLAHMFWGVLDDSCRHFRNPLSPEAARSRYTNPESVYLPGTRLVHMAENWHVMIHWWMCHYQCSGLDEERQQKWVISQWEISENSKVDVNHLQDILHMCPTSNLSTVITCLSCQIMRYMAE